MAQQPLANRLWVLVKHPQFTWWCGHCIVLFCTTIYFWYWITLSWSEGISYYYTAYLGAMLSYGVVVYKSFGSPQLNWEYLQRIKNDENVFYLALALMWFMSTPVFVTLIPYATFSLFHFITYLRVYILQAFSPASPGTQTRDNSASRHIQIWVHKNYEPAMKMVSFVEVVVITLFLLFNILTLQLRFFVIILFFYGSFLRKRYHKNLYTQQAFALVARKLDDLLLPPAASPNIPPSVTKAYQHAKSAIIWIGRRNPHNSRRD
uniref:Tetra-spanning protein 1 n=1 Tax=Anthurium amnicola TaxID=1678845 RepID=A0A1D1XK92_9ARAE